jgi:hypothetical protein
MSQRRAESNSPPGFIVFGPSRFDHSFTAKLRQGNKWSVSQRMVQLRHHHRPAMGIRKAHMVRNAELNAIVRFSKYKSTKYSQPLQDGYNKIYSAENCSQTQAHCSFRLLCKFEGSIIRLFILGNAGAKSSFLAGAGALRSANHGCLRVALAVSRLSGFQVRRPLRTRARGRGRGSRRRSGCWDTTRENPLHASPPPEDPTRLMASNRPVARLDDGAEAAFAEVAPLLELCSATDGEVLLAAGRHRREPKIKDCD